MTGRERLRQVAPILWGDRWQTAMSQELGMNPRTLRRYLAQRDVPEFLLKTLDQILVQRVGLIAAALGAWVAVRLSSGEKQVFTDQGKDRPLLLQEMVDLERAISAIRMREPGEEKS